MITNAEEVQWYFTVTITDSWGVEACYHRMVNVIWEISVLASGLVFTSITNISLECDSNKYGIS